MSESGESPPQERMASVLGLGLPMVLAMGGHAFFNIMDLAMVGAYESDPVRAEQTIAGVTIASLLTTAPLVFANGVSNGTVPVISRAFGARKIQRANLFGRQALLLCGVMSIVLGVVPALFAEQIAVAFGAQEGVELLVSTEYLAVMSYGAFTGFFLMQITANMRAIGLGMLPMVLLLASNFGNILGNWVLIYGHWGFEPMGAAGAAWSTVLARGVSVILGILVLFRAHPAIRISLGGWRPRARFLWQVVATGMPVALQWTLRLGSLLLILFVIADFGPHVRAAYGIGTRLETLAMFAGLGWGAACSPLVGHALARGNIEEARQVARSTILLCIATMSAAGVCYFLFPEPLIGLFSLSTESEMSNTVREGSTYLMISVFAYPALSAAVVYSHVLNGGGSVRTPLVIDAVGLLGVQWPLAWALTHTEFARETLGLGIEGAWWALVASHSVIALVYYVVFRRGAWERKRLR